MGGSCAASPREQSSDSGQQHDQDQFDDPAPLSDNVEQSTPPEHDEHRLNR
jgi:hypothetical protein